MGGPRALHEMQGIQQPHVCVCVSIPYFSLRKCKIIDSYNDFVSSCVLRDVSSMWPTCIQKAEHKQQTLSPPDG